VTAGFGIRGTSLALSVALACAGLAAAQDLAGDSPLAGATPVATDTQAVVAALAAARAGDGARVRSVIEASTDPLVRKISLWALADAAPERMTWAQADEAWRELADWPRASRRRMAAERLIDRSGLPPAAMVAWFGADDPLTGEGALALAGALADSGRGEAAAAVVRKAWRTLVFDAATQDAILQRFGADLGPADHVARADLLLYGAQGPAVAALLPLLPADQQAIALARMAVRRGDPGAQAMIGALPAADQVSPGLAYELVLALRDRGDTAGAVALAPYLPGVNPDEHAAQQLWKHGALMAAALQAGDVAGAYQVAAHAGLVTGPEAADAAFRAGWLALTRLKDPRLADAYFARLQAAGTSPLTQSRALYWRGRAAEAGGDPVAAQIFYGQAARYSATFYGQLAATRGGPADLVLGHDPEITDADRARFEARDPVRAARLLHGLGSSEGVRAFVVSLSEGVTSATDAALLVDLARSFGDPELAMRVVRNAARRGVVLPERGYPLLPAPSVPDGAETPLVLSVARQESSFDPAARSGAGARGLMQLMPATAVTVARRSGLGRGSLEDPDFNLRVGSVYLAQLVSQFSGSYVLAAAAYNAGPSRPIQWTSLCGDPRGSGADPLDFIECIPFSETRDYVMRVMEGAQVYRARLAGGSAPITLAQDLRRGAYDAAPAVAVAMAPPGPVGR
jgi:soluble lytic murein transglycosylase